MDPPLVPSPTVDPHPALDPAHELTAAPPLEAPATPGTRPVSTVAPTADPHPALDPAHELTTAPPLETPATPGTRLGATGSLTVAPSVDRADPDFAFAPGTVADVVEAVVSGQWSSGCGDASPLEWEIAHRLRTIVTVARNPRLRLGPDGSAWFVPGGTYDPHVGLLLPEHLQQLLNDPDVRIRLTPAHVAVTGRAALTYRPGAAVARAVRQRDRTCRFPGCGVPASRCDLDHVVAYPSGTTAMDNLHALCRTHHGFKHHAGWTITMTPDGECTWRAPNGRSHTTTPPDPFDRAA